MSSTIKEFISLSLGAIVVYLIVVHYTGAEKTITAVGGSTANIFKTLQGR